VKAGGNNLGGGTLARRQLSHAQTAIGGARQQAAVGVAGPSAAVTGTGERAAQTGGSSQTAPLYERLPRGPHRMGPDEVAANQRLRMYGAMIEAVATNGYGRTSVKQVVTLAGVSRRAFYEQFANKQECFLATLELIASQAMDSIAMGYG